LNKLYYSIFFFFLAFICNAQLINKKPIEISLGPVSFNKDSIRAKKIKSISVSIVDKPDGSVIIDKGAMQGFEFDTAGRVTRYYYTILNRAIKKDYETPAIYKKGRLIQAAESNSYIYYLNDTIFCTIFYNEKSQIIGKRVQTGDYYDAYYYEYNEEGNIKKELHCKETNVSENKKEFKLGVQTILSSETYEYQKLTPTQTKKRFLNDEGREYKKAIINYDSKGNIVNENYEFIVSWMQKNIAYTYNEKFQLKELALKSNEGGEINKKQTFEYDEKGNVITEKQFTNDILTNEISYLYDETKTFLKSHIDRDFKNTTIGIVKYAYTFY